jgi:hypothetical protein
MTLSVPAPPVTVERYLSALGAAEWKQAAALTARDCLTALPDPAALAENAGRRITRDVRDVPEWLAATFAGGKAEPRVVLGTGTAWLVEGTVGADTFVLTLQLDADGQLARQLGFRVPLVEPSASWDATGDGPDHDVRATVDAYFEHLEDANFEAAADCFAPDALYSHPPYKPGAGRAEFRGRDELLAGFGRRGARAVRHHIDHAPQAGADCLLEGHTMHEDPTLSFVSSVSVAEDGRIRRYLALACPTVPPK